MCWYNVNQHLEVQRDIRTWLNTTKSPRTNKIYLVLSSLHLTITSNIVVVVSISRRF